MKSLSSYVKLSVVGPMIVFSLLPIGRAVAAAEKELYLPQDISRVPKGNDFNDVQSEFCFKHMVQGDSMALFWSKEYGDDPTGS